jgi:putative NADH-flavin reductase
MLSHTIAQQLRSRGHDFVAVVEDPSLMALPDEAILAAAAAQGRAFVTANIKDFTPLDHRYKASGRTHAGLVLVSTKAFPQDRAFIGALVSALDKFLDEDRPLTDAVVFLQR